MAPDVSLLNVRLGSRPFIPPAEKIKKVVALPGVQAARPLVGEPPRAAILEDEDRRRVLVLSTGERDEEPIRVFVLEDVDLESRVPRVTACAQQRQCASDRRPNVGGLGCVAFCVVDAFRP